MSGKTFFITYKGALFEGEKYLGTTDKPLKLFLSSFGKRSCKLQGLTKEDLRFLQNEIKMNYPDAKINWKSPIEQLMKDE